MLEQATASAQNVYNGRFSSDHSTSAALGTSIVDTNVARVLARWSGRRLRPTEVQAMADASVPFGLGWTWNQTLLDLGAVVCRARNPACTDCPIREGCSWRGSGCGFGWAHVVVCGSGG